MEHFYYETAETDSQENFVVGYGQFRRIAFRSLNKISTIAGQRPRDSPSGGYRSSVARMAIARIPRSTPAPRRKVNASSKSKGATSAESATPPPSTIVPVAE